jgi:membrane dipeptidase
MLVSLLVLLPVTALAQEESDAADVDHARRVLAENPVFDGHNDLPWAIREFKDAPRDVAAYDLNTRTPGHTDIERLRAGGVGAQFWSVYTPGEMADSGYARLQLEQIDIALRVIERYPELTLALTAADVERAMAAGTIASLLGIEGGHAIENSLGALRAYYALGVRYMTLTHNVTLDWVDAAQDTAWHDGLTVFGEEVVREMNRLGMLVDLSHVSPAAMNDVLNVADAPVIFSHSSARGLTDVPRNVPDAILARLPANGGVVMVTFVPSFVSTAMDEWWRGRERALAELVGQGAADSTIRRWRSQYGRENPAPRVTISDVADHIEHVRDLAGIDHVGIGGDYDGSSMPEGLEDVSRYPYLFAELIRRGWTEADLAKLANGNILRAMRGAEATARRLRAEREPSTATIG